MLLKSNKSKAVISDNLKAGEFKIDSNPYSFKILSDNLYKDKILAPVREYICNAYDAYIESSQIKPFDVTLPTELNNQWSVRDYGKGISPENIEDVFTVYFKSTKTSDAKAIGGFGLGCKSAFAYTKSFFVTSWFEGVKRVYAVTLDNNTPKFILFSEDTTDEPSGLEIKFNVFENDLNTFKVKSLNVLKYFPQESYNITNVKVDKLILDTEFESSYGKMVKNIDTGHIHLVISNIAYLNIFPLDAWKLTKSVDFLNSLPDFSKKVNLLKSTLLKLTNLPISYSIPNIVLHFNNSEITCSPDRENIEATEENFNAILKALNDYIDSYKKELNDLAQKYQNNLISSEFIDRNFNWNLHYDAINANPLIKNLSHKLLDYVTSYTFTGFSNINSNFKVLKTDLSIGKPFVLNDFVNDLFYLTKKITNPSSSNLIFIIQKNNSHIRKLKKAYLEHTKHKHEIVVLHCEKSSDFKTVQANFKSLGLEHVYIGTKELFNELEENYNYKVATVSSNFKSPNSYPVRLSHYNNGKLVNNYIEEMTTQEFKTFLCQFNTVDSIHALDWFLPETYTPTNNGEYIAVLNNNSYFSNIMTNFAKENKINLVKNKDFYYEYVINTVTKFTQLESFLLVSSLGLIVDYDEIYKTCSLSSCLNKPLYSFYSPKSKIINSLHKSIKVCKKILNLDISNKNLNKVQALLEFIIDTKIYLRIYDKNLFEPVFIKYKTFAEKHSKKVISTAQKRNYFLYAMATKPFLDVYLSHSKATQILNELIATKSISHPTICMASLVYHFTSDDQNFYFK